MTLPSCCRRRAEHAAGRDADACNCKREAVGRPRQTPAMLLQFSGGEELGVPTPSLPLCTSMFFTGSYVLILEVGVHILSLFAGGSDTWRTSKSETNLLEALHMDGL